MTGRLVVVSNRTPKPGKVAAGGLAAALDGVLKQLGGIWVGWSGDFAEKPGALAEVTKLLVALSGSPMSAATRSSTST